VTQIQKLEQLIYWYNIARRAYLRHNDPISNWLMQKLYTKIRALYKQYPTLEHTYKILVQTKDQILGMIDPVSLALLNRTQAVKHLNKLLNERNQSSSALRYDWEYAIRITVKELRMCGHVICVDMSSDTWQIMK
jgi:hypothetical protein